MSSRSSSTLEQAFSTMRQSFNDYAPLSDKTWQQLKAFCQLRKLDKGEILYAFNQVPNSFAYVVEGLVRVYIIDQNGHEYNKKFFDKTQFPACISALLTQTPSQFCVDALEDSWVMEIQFKAYRQLLLSSSDLKLFQIYYLEKNWVLDKDSREVEIIQEDAAQRYQRFLKEYPNISSRIPQYHIASHLGITPTQLSRIRKNLGA